MTDHPVKRRKKLIEVAIPLEAINAASAREKKIHHGHPSTMHLWWARRPLASARAVIFCQMVDDPSDITEEFYSAEAQENERLRLFAIVSELVQWENTTNEKVLNKAREEIHRSWRRCCADNAEHPKASELFDPEKLPTFHDPFAGGGALPLEAQRLGMQAYASDLNPVAVLINKAMIEIPPRYAGLSPVNPESRAENSLIKREREGAEGLAEDVDYYGKWMVGEARKRIGSLYQDVQITDEMVSSRSDLEKYRGRTLPVIGWIWARTVRSPDPSFSGVDVPLVSSFVLSKARGKEAYIEPVLSDHGYSFSVRQGAMNVPAWALAGTKLSRGANFQCLMSKSPISSDYIKAEGVAGRMGYRLMAIVAEGTRCRIYLDPSSTRESSLTQHAETWRPSQPLPTDPRNFWTVDYGLDSFSSLFTERQLVQLDTFSRLIEEVKAIATEDIKAAEQSDRYGDEYASAICTYLSLAVSRHAASCNSLVTWNSTAQKAQRALGRQSLPMSWDFCETNPFGEATGSFSSAIALETGPLRLLGKGRNGFSFQLDASTQELSKGKVISTDPPYYDNISYADLSDFFYPWLRRMLSDIYPEILGTLSTPKADELVAQPYRHGSKKAAETFFMEGMSRAMSQLSACTHHAYPSTIYYAFKQSEVKRSGDVLSTGWDAFLTAVINSGFAIKGTWPLRTEMTNWSKEGINALASSLIIVCDRPNKNRPVISRSEFRRSLRRDLPQALCELEKMSIAPVDVAQSAIGPGMAIFSSAKAVLNPDDSPMTVRDALIEINAALDEYLSQGEGDLDADSRFALTFFESFGYSERDFGDAEGLAKARNVSVHGVASSGILRSVAGKAWLIRREQLDVDWDPTRDDRLCAWEATQHLIKRLEKGGEGAAAELLGQLKKIAGRGDLAANCRALAYRLYNHCEKTKQAEEARAYNGLVIAWPELERLAASQPTETTVQASLI